MNIQNNISSVLIQKLGHEIPEIRVRALQNLLSKFELGLNFDNEIPRSMELLEKLLQFFDIEPVQQEKSVLHLIENLLNSQIGISLIKYKGSKSLIQDLSSIKCKVDENYYDQLGRIMAQVQKIDGQFNVVPPLVSDLPLSYRSGDSIPFHSSSNTQSKSLDFISKRNEKFDEQNESQISPNLSGNSQRHGILKSSLAVEGCGNNSDQHRSTSEKQIRFSDPVLSGVKEISTKSSSSSQYSQNSEQSKSCTNLDNSISQRFSSPRDETITSKNILINHFPKQPLTSSDYQILKSLENSLNVKNLHGNPQEILNSLKFLRQVALKDFPPEIFLQNPEILNILYGLVETATSTRLSTAVFQCFYEISERLCERVKILTDPNLKGNYDDKVKYFENGSRNNSSLIYENIPKNFSQNSATLDSQNYSLPIFALNTLNLCLNYIFEKRQIFANEISKKKLIPPIDSALKLINSLIEILILSVKPGLFYEKISENEKVLLGAFLTVFENFSQILDQLKIMVQIKEDEFLERLTQISLIISVLKILEALMPNRAVHTIPKNLQTTLSTMLLDTAFSKLFSEAHEILLQFCTEFGSNCVPKNEYHRTKKVTCAMTSAIKILRYEMKIFEKLGLKDSFHLILNSLPALEYHRNFKIIDLFFELCIKISSAQLCDVYDVINDVFLTLLGHSDPEISKLTHTKIHCLVKNRLGPNYAKIPQCTQPTVIDKYGLNFEKTVKFVEDLDKVAAKGYDDVTFLNSEIFQGSDAIELKSQDSDIIRPFAKMSQIQGNDLIFLVQPKILTEIMINGLGSPNSDIKAISEDLILLMLKAKNLVTQKTWDIYILNLAQVFPLLCCFADDTQLGRTVIKMFDPDVSLTLNVPKIETVKANLRFLFSKNQNLRGEAVGRILWLLTMNADYEIMVPKIKTLDNESLRDIFLLEKDIDLKFRDFQNFYQTSNLEQVLGLLNPGVSHVDFDLFKSALNQISVMIVDAEVQRNFLRNEGLQIILRILHDNLMEKNFASEKLDILKLTVIILKNLCLKNSLLREELSVNSDLLYDLVRILILVQEKYFKNEITTLLGLLLFSNLIKTSAKGLTFPNLFEKSLNWPFKTNFYEHNLKVENFVPDEIFMKTLRIHWNIEYFGGINEIFDKKGSGAPEIPTNLVLREFDLHNLKTTSIEFAFNDFLTQIQNGTTHFSVLEALWGLQGYLNLFLNLGDYQKNILAPKVIPLPWKQSLMRFVSAPCFSNGADRDIFKEILKVLAGIFNLNFENFDSFSGIFLDMKKILYDNEINVDLFNFLTTFLEKVPGGVPNFDFSCVFEGIRDNLRGPGAQFYDLNYLNSVLSCFKELTAKEGWSKSFGKNLNDNFCGLLSCLWEILTVFEGEKNFFSFMGVFVTRTTLSILNHILAEMQLVKKSYDYLWFDQLNFDYQKICNGLLKSRDIFIKNEALMLLSGLVLTPRGATIIVMESHRSVWNMALEIFLDKNESCILRENAALLLTNMTSHAAQNLKNGSDFNLPLAHTAFNCRADLPPNDTLLLLLEEFNFYEILNETLLEFFIDCQRNDRCLGPMSSQDHLLHFENLNDFEMATTGLVLPSLVKNSALFLNNLVCLNAEKVCGALHEYQIVRSYFRCLHFPPLVGKNSLSNQLHYNDVMEMNAVICLLLTCCASANQKCLTMCLNTKDCLNVSVGLLNPEIYDNAQPKNLILRNKVFSEVFLFLSVLVQVNFPIENVESTKNIEAKNLEILKQILFDEKNHCFIKALFLSIENTNTKSFSNLQKNGLKFLINLSSPKKWNLRFLEKFFDDKFKNFSDNFFENYVYQNWSYSKSGQKIKSQVSSLFENLTFGSILAMALINLYKLEYFENKDLKKKELILGALSSLFSQSQSAKILGLNQGFIKDIKANLLALNLELNIHSMENSRVSEKKKVNPLLKELDLTLSLVNNFCMKNSEVKETVVNADLPDQLHKFFVWLQLDRSALANALCLIGTLTAGSEKACVSLILTSGNFGCGPKRTPSIASLLSVVCDTVSKQFNNVSKVKDLQIFDLGMLILGNVCCVSECRSVLAKQTTLFQSFLRLHPQLTKHQKPWDQIERVVLNFLKTFTFFLEGQAILGRKSELLDLVYILATNSKVQQHRLLALQIIRHVSFNHVNRIVLLSSMEFLHLLKSKLVNSPWEEKHAVITALWAIAANNQRSKNLIRCAGIDAILDELIQKTQLKKNSCDNLDGFFENFDKALQEANFVLKILREGSVSVG